MNIVKRLKALGSLSPKSDVFIKSIFSGFRKPTDEEVEETLYDPVDLEDIKEMNSSTQTGLIHI